MRAFVVLLLAAVAAAAAAILAIRRLRSRRLAGIPRSRSILRKHPLAETLTGRDEVVIALPRQGEGLALNAVAARCWELIDGSRSVIEIARIVAREYGVEVRDALVEVRAFSRRVKQELLALEEAEWDLVHVHFHDLFAGMPGEGLRELRLSETLIVHATETIVAGDGTLRPWAGSNKDRLESARAMREHRLREEPLEAAARDYRTGWDLCAAGDLDGAERSFRRCLKAAPQWASAHYQLGYVLLRGKAFDDSIRAFTMADTLHPGLHMVREYLDQARRISAGALSHDAFLLLDRANASGLKDPDATIRLVRKAIEISPRYPSAHLILARAWEKKARNDLALQALGRAIESEPDRSTLCQALFTRGAIFMSQGRSDLAMREWEKVIEIDGSEPATRSALLRMAATASPH